MLRAYPGVAGVTVDDAEVVVVAPELGTPDLIRALAPAAARIFIASCYIFLCMLSIAAITLALGLLPPHGPEALAPASPT